ncbi:MAG: ribonuclease R [Gemmatimonadota bacterium]
MSARRKGGSGGRRGRRGGSRVRGGDRVPKSAGESERAVLDALAASTTGPLKAKELARALRVSTHDYRNFRRLLRGMEERGVVHRVRGHRYVVTDERSTVEGKIRVTQDGHGFVRPSGPGEDVYVAAHKLDSAMDGDGVVVRIDRQPRGRNPEGSVLRVVSRARDRVVGTYREGRRLSYVTPLDARFRRDVLIHDGAEGAAEDGHIVVVSLTSYGDAHVGPTGEVSEVLGAITDPGVDVLAIAHGFGLSTDFPPEVTAAAEAAARGGLAEPGPDRVDRTDLLVFTIDPADAKDHDDALSLREGADGRLEVGVHIADVSHFVRPDDVVDAEAFARATSVYLVDRTIPMLPYVLSTDVCSLAPGGDRFAVSVFVELDREGNILDRRYERTVLRCSAGLSYEEAQEVLDGTGTVSREIDEAIRRLDDLARVLRERKRTRGALDLDLPEATVILDPDGSPVDIRKRDRLSSHRLIEDFMVLANEVVATDLEARDLSAMYRIHERPSREKIDALVDTLARFGVSMPRRGAIKPTDVQRALEQVRGKEEEALVSHLVLRSLAKARYHTVNEGHFGLASSAYAHFTSPIRRYPDLVVHRVLTDVLIHSRPEPWPDRDALERAAEHCSSREQAAAEAERASVDLKKVEFMERHLGDVFSGRVSGVMPFGFFVTLDDVFVDGLVHVRALEDDHYRFVEREHVLRGERGGRAFRLGDPVEVQVVRVDRELRRIDFGIPRSGRR